MNSVLFTKELIGKSGGILISDIIDGEQIVFLGKSNIPKRNNEYEGFGGKVEIQDLTSLHTALREMIEEFFNIKPSINFINDLAVKIVNSNYILHRVELFGMSYLIDLIGLEFIFTNIIEAQDIEFDSNELIQYQTINKKFDYDKYITERKINDMPQNGLNEILSIHICKLSDIKKKNIYCLRWFTSRIIYEMLIKNRKLIKK